MELGTGLPAFGGTSPDAGALIVGPGAFGAACPYWTGELSSADGGVTDSGRLEIACVVNAADSGALLIDGIELLELLPLDDADTSPNIVRETT